MKLFILLTLFFSFNSFSKEGVCESNVEFLENMRIQTGKFKLNDCFISLSPRKTNGMYYRTFLITSSGRFLIFNSFGSGPSSTHSGAREFNFFKRTKEISYRILDETVEVLLSNGDKLTFNKELVTPVSIDRGVVEFDPVITPENNGGVNITHYRGLMLDFGFQMGMSPSWYLNRESTFIDEISNTCLIKNSEFLYKKNSEIYWKFKNDERLFDYLKNKCPSIVLPK
jgi:hypothetical protein